ncbi:MAG: hypothetical protein ACKN9T_10795 [Candidatus Methylumidiphilus sp.]
MACRPRPNSLCVITSRLTVADLAGRATVNTHDLHNLELADGVALLQSLHVLGPQAELEQTVRDYGHHALALSLLGHAVNYWLEGDVRRRDTITELLDGNDTPSRHAFKVMQAYVHWLGGAELRRGALQETEVGLWFMAFLTGIRRPRHSWPGTASGVFRKPIKPASPAPAK